MHGTVILKIGSVLLYHISENYFEGYVDLDRICQVEEMNMADDAKTKPLMTKAALIERVKEAFETLSNYIDSLSEKDLQEPIGGGTWSWVDTIAHIASWEQILVRFHIGGEPFDQVIEMEGAKYRITSYDTVNEHLFKRYHGLSAHDVKTLINESHKIVQAAIESFPEDQLHQPHPLLSTGDAAGVNWIDYIAANTFEHYEEHLMAR